MQAGQDRIARLFQHVLQQNHMYPVFPPAPNACIDYAHTEHLDLPRTPHVLALPAPFPPCVKVVQARSEDCSSGELLTQRVLVFVAGLMAVSLIVQMDCRCRDCVHQPRICEQRHLGHVHRHAVAERFPTR